MAIYTYPCSSGHTPSPSLCSPVSPRHTSSIFCHLTPACSLLNLLPCNAQFCALVNSSPGMSTFAKEGLIMPPSRGQRCYLNRGISASSQERDSVLWKSSPEQFFPAYFWAKDCLRLALILFLPLSCVCVETSFPNLWLWEQLPKLCVIPFWTHPLFLAPEKHTETLFKNWEALAMSIPSMSYIPTF